ncbi:MAG: molybdenum cofactor biosynthesis protein MoaE [Acidobacteriota bacterium]
MQVTVVAFATAGDLVGQGPQTIRLDDGATLNQLKALLLERHPRLEALWPRLAVAVDGELVTGGDAALRDGVEVALLPPVSGGAPEAPAVSAPAALHELVHGPIDIAAAERSVARPNCGAVLLFVGAVRNHHEGRGVAMLTYSAYESMAQAQIGRICRELEAAATDAQRVHVTIVHRLGDVPVGEPSVVIAVASPHREAAYGASRTALERLKKEVPIWKREHYADGDVAWREEEPLAPVG